MKSTFPSLVILMFSLSGLLASCEKEDPVSPNPPVTTTQPRTPVAPTARAGNDTTLFFPFSTYVLNGEASRDPDFNIVSYTWRRINGPSLVNILLPRSVKSLVGNLTNEGTYEFELTVTDADNLSAKDTVKVTVAIPPCTSAIREVLLKDLEWLVIMHMMIEIKNPYSYLPPNSYIKNLYIKRDDSDEWELINCSVYSMYVDSPFHEWIFLNNTLTIFPGSNLKTDTPDLKIEYCQ